MIRSNTQNPDTAGGACISNHHHDTSTGDQGTMFRKGDSEIGDAASLSHSMAIRSRNTLVHVQKNADLR